MSCRNDSILFEIIKKDLQDYLGYFGVSTNVVLIVFLVILILSCVSNITLIAEQDSGPRRQNSEDSTIRMEEGITSRRSAIQPPAYHVIMRDNQS